MFRKTHAQISAASITAIGDKSINSVRLLKRDDDTIEESDDRSSEIEERN